MILRQKTLYYDEEDWESRLRYEYDIRLYSGQVIICTIKLPPLETMKMLTGGISAEKGKKEIWGKIDTIQEICTRIKKRDPDNILAVIPKFNPMVYLNGEIRSSMDELDPLCDTLCMFVKNTSQGQALVEKLKQLPPHSLIDSSEDDDD